MRISILCAGNRVFGLEIMALTLARGLRARGHNVFVVMSGWHDGQFQEQLRRAELPYMEVFFGKISKSARLKAMLWTLDALWHLPAARQRLAKHLRTFRPDVVLAYNRDWMVLAASILRHQRTVFHAHELPRLSASSRAVYQLLTKSTKMIVAASEHVAVRLQEIGVPADHTMVIYNGLESVGLRAHASDNDVKPLTIGIIGQIAAWKGHDDLVDALAILKGAGEDFRCVVFGTGDSEYVQTLKDKARRLGVLEWIAWKGYVRDSSEAFAQMEICVVPSRVEEAFGLAAAEAGLHCIPVVAARSGALSEIVLDGITGFLVAPSQPRELAARLRLLLTDSRLRATLGEAAHLDASRRFRASRMVESFEDLCTRLVASP